MPVGELLIRLGVELALALLRVLKRRPKKAYGYVQRAGSVQPGSELPAREQR